LYALKQFAERFFKVSFWAECQQDSRGANVEIPTGTIFKVLVFQVAWGCRSLLALDQRLRLGVFRNFFDCSRKMVVSDTTIRRSLGGWDLDDLRRATAMTHARMRSEKQLTYHFATGRSCRPCIADGSGFGKLLACALVAVGDKLTCGLDVEPMRKRGTELAATRRMMERVNQTLGGSFATHLLYDGLMADRIDFRNAVSLWKTHLVVKTDDERLEPIRWAKDLFADIRSESDAEDSGVVIATGTDEIRNVEYEVWRVSGVTWEGLEFPLNVARVVETPLKGENAGKPQTFWVLASDLSLLPSELRELAHLRWRIENNLFKSLNARVGSKRAYIHNAHVRLALLLIWFLGWTIFQSFNALETVRQVCPGVKVTDGFVQDLIVFGELGFHFSSS
jgi:hypothetical protein